MGRKQTQASGAGAVTANFHGPVNSPVAVGTGNRVENVQITGQVPQPDREELKRLLAELKTQVGAQAPPEKRTAALNRVEELEQAATEAAPDQSTLELIQGWFVKNLPALAGGVASVINPLLGKVVTAAGDALAGQVRRRLGE